MKIRIKLFGNYRELIGKRTIVLDLSSKIKSPRRGGGRVVTVRNVIDTVISLYPALKVHKAAIIAAVNRQYVGFDEKLKNGDELALLPPVSGG